MNYWKQYVRYLRKSHKHIQHVHAVFFAGTITCILAAIILYSQYGFWNQRYTRENDFIPATNTEETMEPPSEMIASFMEEVSTRFGTIKQNIGTLLEGKDSYSQE